MVIKLEAVYSDEGIKSSCIILFIGEIGRIGGVSKHIVYLYKVVVICWSSLFSGRRMIGTGPITCMLSGKGIQS